MTRRQGWILATTSVIVIVGVLGRADRYADGDMGHLIAVEMRVAQLFRAGEVWTALRLWWALITPQPPLGYLPGIVSYTILGFYGWIAPLVMGVSLLLIWDAFWRLWGPRAWMAWLPLCASPLVWLAVEQHSRDLLAAATLAQTLSWWFASEGLSLRRAAIGFGVWLGLGFMTKYTFPIFAAFVCLAVGLGLLYRPRLERWKNLGFGVLGFVAPAGAWYAVRGAAVLQYVGFSSGEKMSANTANYRDPATLENLAYYPLALRDALSLPGAFLVVAAIALGFRHRQHRGLVAVSLVGALGGLAVLSSLPEAIDRYAIPAFILLTGLVPALGPRVWAALPVLAAFLPMLAYTAGRFKPGAPIVTASYDHPLASAGAIAWPFPPAYRPSDLDPSSWRLPEVVAALREAQGRTDGTIGILSGRGPTAGPNFATVLIAGARAGVSYDYATINTQFSPGAPEVFVGPLFDGVWPPSTFTILVAFRSANGDTGVDHWLGAHTLSTLARIPGPAGGSSTIYRLSTSGGPGSPR
ncbi:hypothetical protein LBMAG42_46130 [Deltaproteobacteria bacterium]|nr:hypothetical protein LBMAG42_46130 [Deltaproteobacteria bacterium]